MQHHWIQEKVKSKNIAITSLSAKYIVAERLIKALDGKLFKYFWTIIGMNWAGRQNMIEWECWKYNHIIPKGRIHLHSVLYRLSFVLSQYIRVLFLVLYISNLMYYMFLFFHHSYCLILHLVYLSAHIMSQTLGISPCFSKFRLYSKSCLYFKPRLTIFNI